MATDTIGSITIRLLADEPHLIPLAGDLRWREWGRPPEPVERDWWVAVTAREAGRDALPVTWVALDARGQAVGAVGLGEYDIEERRDRSPWVLGMVVAPDRRGQGVGRQLMNALEAWAAQRGYSRAWVASGPAAGFYQACGWILIEWLQRSSGETMAILTKAL
jgi:GNAT superfamily N-acetyltransferase